MANVALVTDAVTSQVVQFSAFDVSDYMPHGDPVDPSAELNALEQMEILVDVVCQSGQKGRQIGREHGARGGPARRLQDRR